MQWWCNDHTKPKVLSYWLIVQKPLSDWLDLLWWNHWHTLGCGIPKTCFLLSSTKQCVLAVRTEDNKEKTSKNSVKMHHQMNSSDIGNNSIIIFKIFSIWMPRYDFFKMYFMQSLYIFSKFVLAKQLVQGHQVWFSRLWIFILGCTGSPHFTWFHFTWLLEK